MSFEQCIAICAANRETIAEYDRLHKKNLSMAGTPLDLSINEATGQLADDVADFVAWVAQRIWLPMVRAESAYENARTKDLA